MDLAADYAAVVHQFQSQTLPPYIAYTEESSARGIFHGAGAAERIVVDVKTGRVVERTRVGTAGSLDFDEDDTDGVTRYIFPVSCYHPISESTTTWNGHAAMAFALQANGSKGCDSDRSFAINTLYADPATRDPIGADGTETDDDMTIDFSMTYQRYGAYLLPASIQGHAKGRGFLFWARERAEVKYSNYTFSTVRRQNTEAGP